MTKFQHIEWGWLLLALPVFTLLFWSVIRWKKKTMATIGDPDLVKTLLRGNAPKRFRFSHWVLSVAMVLLVLALCNLRKPAGKQQISKSGVDVMIALDVSKSMLATDLTPNRLERAKQLVNKLMDELTNDRVGLVLFAGRAYMQMPLTADLSAARLFVNAANPGMVASQGTVVKEALELSNTAFDPQETKYKAVLLITDGEDHDPEAVAKAKAMSENGVMIVTIGIGSPEGSTIPDEVVGGVKRDKDGQVIISKLNDQLLREIARVTQGEYVQLVSTDMAVKGIKSRLSKMDQRSIQDTSLAGFHSYYHWFLYGGLILLLLEFFMNTIPAKLLKNGLLPRRSKL